MISVLHRGRFHSINIHLFSLKRQITTTLTCIMADINTKDVLGDYEEKPDIWASAVRRLLILYLYMYIRGMYTCVYDVGRMISRE